MRFSQDDERANGPWPSNHSCRREAASLHPSPSGFIESRPNEGGWVVEACGRRDLAGLTVWRLTRAARAHVATAARRTACLHVSRAMQAARRRADFDFPSRLGRRAEAGPRRVLPRVRPPIENMPFLTYAYG